jgi:hypothetical protein
MQITLSLPVSKLEALGQTRRQGVQTTTINGYAVRSAYLNHCEGVWRGICSSNLSTSREWITGQVSAEVVNEECSGAVKNPPRCASGAVPCGGGLRVAAVAFRSDPCSEEISNSILIAVIVGVVVPTLALLVCFYCALTRFGLQQGKDSSDNSDSDSYTDSDSRIDDYGGLFRADSPPIIMENDPGSIYFDNYRYFTHHSSPRPARHWLTIASMHTVVYGKQAGQGGGIVLPPPHPRHLTQGCGSRRLGAPPLTPKDVELSLMRDIPGPYPSVWSHGTIQRARASSPMMAMSGFGMGAPGQMGGLVVKGPGSMLRETYQTLSHGSRSAPSSPRGGSVGLMAGMPSAANPLAFRPGSVGPMAGMPPAANPFLTAFRPIWQQ